MPVLTISLVLLLVGAVALCIEALMPGFGVFGVIGILLIIASSVCMVLFLPYGFYLMIVEMCLIATALYFAFKYIKSRQLYGKLILNETLNTEEKEIGAMELLIGKEGVSKTPLKPVGHVDFNGTTLEVTTEGVFVPENERVKVIDVKNNQLIVRQVVIPHSSSTCAQPRQTEFHN